MAYVSQEMKAKLAPAIKAICKKYGVKATIAVRHNSTLVLNIKSAKVDFFGDYSKNSSISRGHMQVNICWCRESFSGKSKEFFNEIIPAMEGADYFDESDVQTDYFYVSHYIDINIGSFDKHFVYEG